jgi:hypothetical protein
MGRTLPTITQIFLEEQDALGRFRRALRRADQRALDDLLAAARQHLAAASYAAHLMPFETLLLCMLLEEHKEVLRLRDGLAALRAQHGAKSEEQHQNPLEQLPERSLEQHGGD